MVRVLTLNQLMLATSGTDIRTTRPDRSARKAPDGLRRDFTPPQRPDVRWCGDLTEIPTEDGRLQLAAVLPSASTAAAPDGRFPDASLLASGVLDPTTYDRLYVWSQPDKHESG
jgi:hypothetical protein